MTRIALDAMGGDHAPQAPVAGALLAAATFGSEHSIQLVGQAQVIRDELARQGASAAFEVIDAPDVITMSDKPSVAIRGKPNSSMTLGLRLQAEGKSDAFVSAGNTGAQMAASVFVLRLFEGLNRPAIATVFPTATQPVVVLDSGANVDCSPHELLNFAQLGHVYAKDILGRDRPAIGLLSIGEEAEKGNAAVKEAHALIAAAGLNFLGNIEGRDVPRGACDGGAIDIVVCDGFVGNVMLKFYEGVAPVVLGMVMQTGVPQEQIAALKHTLDYSAVGGAPLLGVKGVSIICHGSSSAEAIKNGILVGLRAVETRMTHHVGEAITP